MIKKLFLLILPIYLFALTSPYENLSVEEKVSILVNYFFNEELRAILPQKPPKEKIKDNSEITRVQYEQYYSYIQRLKNIKESRAEEKRILDETYAGAVGYYNGKVSNLEAFYNIEENRYQFLQNSINKTFKILFGKPKISKPFYDKQNNKLYTILSIESIYGFNTYKDQKLEIQIDQSQIAKLVDGYREAKVNVAFLLHDGLLKTEFVNIEFQGDNYKAYFIEKNNNNLKLEIKINDDIFRKIKIEDKK